jgi:hypothetical protein
MASIGRDPHSGEESSDRTARYLARVDAHLPTLADPGARRAFIDRQIEAWERRYARFVATEGGSQPAGGHDPPQAGDFVMTIAALAARRAAPGRPRSEARGADEPGESLADAIRSLVLAADQRCPAIIGQTHLLHHAAFCGELGHRARAFAEIKREAHDLLRAIAAVDAAIGEMRE